MSQKSYEDFKSLVVLIDRSYCFWRSNLIKSKLAVKLNPVTWVSAKKIVEVVQIGSKPLKLSLHFQRILVVSNPCQAGRQALCIYYAIDIAKFWNEVIQLCKEHSGSKFSARSATWSCVKNVVPSRTVGLSQLDTDSVFKVVSEIARHFQQLFSNWTYSLKERDWGVPRRKWRKDCVILLPQKKIGVNPSKLHATIVVMVLAFNDCFVDQTNDEPVKKCTKIFPGARMNQYCRWV